LWFGTAASWVLFALTISATAWTLAEDGSRFVLLPVENPRYGGNELFRAFENYDSPRIGRLRDP
jgi:hypothetical protein